jgi:DNA polymerase III gamma/tau subunit
VTLGCAAFYLSAHAARPVDEVAQLLEQGKADQAARQADGYLKQNPGDVEMRFLRGVIATEQKQNAQAIRIFSALTRDYPNLPEPYNNLAVLYAADGQERKASEVLEQAIRTSPSYTTAYENLGDLYARMASDAYAKALQLDGSRQAIQPKLALITQIFPKQGGAQTKVAQNTATAGTSAKAAADTRAADEKAAQARAAEAKAAEAKAAEFKAAEVKAADAKAAQAKAAEAKAAEAKAAEAKAEQAKLAQAKAAEAKAAESKAAQEKLAQEKAAQEKLAQEKARAAEDARQAAAKAAAPAAAATAVAAAEPAKAAPAVDEKKAAQSAAAQEVEAAVKVWSTAWAGQDMDRYLDAYSDHFSPADGSSLAKWKEQRRQRIVGRASIVVTVRDLKVNVDGDKATAQFRQYYASGALKTTTRKTLRMQREKGQWRITHEGTGS